MLAAGGGAAPRPSQPAMSPPVTPLAASHANGTRKAVAGKLGKPSKLSRAKLQSGISNIYIYIYIYIYQTRSIVEPRAGPMVSPIASPFLVLVPVCG